MNGLSIIIPVLRERQNLKKLISITHNSVKKIKNFEIIIVDDDSNDGSIELLKKLKFKFKKLKFIIRKKKPRDLCKSCTLGFTKSRYNNIVVMDGDLQHRPQEINKLYSAFLKKNCDIVVGSRNLFKKKNKGLKFYRLVTSIFLIIAVNILLNFKTSDPMSGFFIFKKKIYLKNKKFLFNRGYKILLDLIYPSKEKLKILDINIDFRSRGAGSSKINYKIIYFLVLVIIKKFFLRVSNIIK